MNKLDTLNNILDICESPMFIPPWWKEEGIGISEIKDIKYPIKLIYDNKYGWHINNNININHIIDRDWSIENSDKSPIDCNIVYDVSVIIYKDPKGFNNITSLGEINNVRILLDNGQVDIDSDIPEDLRGKLAADFIRNKIYNTSVNRYLSYARKLTDDEKEKFAHFLPEEPDTDENKALATAGMLAALLSPSKTADASIDREPNAIVRSVVKPNIIDLFPREMRGILRQESTDGKNVRHSVVKYGVNKGDRAAGFSGLMPITVIETLKKNPNLAKYKFLLDKSNAEITDYLNKNPEVEAAIASAHWNRLDRIFGNDHNKKLFAWNQGITGAKKASREDIDNHWYVVSVLSHEDKLLAIN